MERFDFDELRVEATTTGDVMPRRNTISNGSGDAFLTWLFLALATVAASIGVLGTVNF